MSRKCLFVVGLVVVALAATPPAAALGRRSLSLPPAFSEVGIPAFLARLWAAFGMGRHKNGMSADPDGQPSHVTAPNGESGSAPDPSEACASGS